MTMNCYGDIFGRFDHYDPQNNGGLRGRFDLVYEPKGQLEF